MDKAEEEGFNAYPWNSKERKAFVAGFNKCIELTKEKTVMKNDTLPKEIASLSWKDMFAVHLIIDMLEGEDAIDGVVDFYSEVLRRFGWYKKACTER